VQKEAGNLTAFTSAIEAYGIEGLAVGVVESKL